MSVLMKYMLTLKHTLRKLSCTLPVVLLLDAAPVHLSERILAFASDNGIQLAFIPARLTWLLQPLDTHAFADLKRRIRKQHADLCIASPTGAVSRASTIRQQHRAILEELSDRAWARSMERVGATGIVTNLRPNIATLVAGEDLAARYPSSDDLAALLNIATSRARAGSGQHCAAAANLPRTPDLPAPHTQPAPLNPRQPWHRARATAASHARCASSCRGQCGAHARSSSCPMSARHDHHGRSDDERRAARAPAHRRPTLPTPPSSPSTKQNNACADQLKRDPSA